MYLNNLRCGRKPIYGESLLRLLTVNAHDFSDEPYNKYCLTLSGRVDKMNDTIEKYSIITPAAVALDMKDQLIPISTKQRILHEVAENKIDNPFHKAQVKLSIAFPDKTLLQYDCGKLQKLATLLQELTSQGHRALIFTQMTKVLDILEQFLNIHGYRYMRLDGATKIEDRQLLTEKFNRDPKIPVFILSTRSGGLGINLTGADTVIFMTLIGIRQWTSNVKIVVIELVKFEMFTFIDLFLNTPLSPILSRRRTRKDSWITLLFKRESLLQITLVSSRFVIWSVIAILGRK